MRTIVAAVSMIAVLGLTAPAANAALIKIEGELGTINTALPPVNISGGDDVEVDDFLDIGEGFVSFTFVATETFLVDSVAITVNGRLLDLPNLSTTYALNATTITPATSFFQSPFPGATPTTRGIGFENIDPFSMSSGDEFVLTFNENDTFIGPMNLDVSFSTLTTPIPLPAALPLLSVGLGGLMLLGRRRRQAS